MLRSQEIVFLKYKNKKLYKHSRTHPKFNTTHWGVPQQSHNGSMTDNSWGPHFLKSRKFEKHSYRHQVLPIQKNKPWHLALFPPFLLKISLSTNLDLIME